MVHRTRYGSQRGRRRRIAHPRGQGVVAAIGDRLEVGGDLVRRLVLAVDDFGRPGAPYSVVVDGAVAEVLEVRPPKRGGRTVAVDFARGEPIENVFDDAHPSSRSSSRETTVRVCR